MVQDFTYCVPWGDLASLGLSLFTHERDCGSMLSEREAGQPPGKVTGSRLGGGGLALA